MASIPSTSGGWRGVRRPALLVVLFAVLLATGCGSTRHTAAGARSAIVTEHDFHIAAPASLTAGSYALRVHNEGVTDHELILVRSANGKLPLRADGLTIDEESLEHQESGSLAPGAPGASRVLTVHLTAGRYVFFCNMEGHFMAGMHAELVVS